MKYQVLEHDTEAEASLREQGVVRSVCFISCLGLVQNTEMMRQMQRMMHLIQAEYGLPVDIEFTINVSENREYMINLLQCRPLQVYRDAGGVALPEDVPEDEEDEEEEAAPQIQFQNYPRIGLSFLTFTYDWPTVHDMEVRQAIAYCMDRATFAKDFTTVQADGQRILQAVISTRSSFWLRVTKPIFFPV